MTEEKLPVAQRRFGGGARREASERVMIHHRNSVVESWTLNVSRGGLRVVTEGTLTSGEIVEVVIGETTERRPARIVWLKEATGGQIAGIQLLDSPGSIPPPDDLLPDDPA